MAEVTQALTKVVHDSEGQVEQEQQIIVQTEQTIHGVMADYENAVQAITSANQHLNEQSGYVQQQLSDVVVNLQFQDRASQIISHVIADMDKLATAASQIRQRLSTGQLPDPISVGTVAGTTRANLYYAGTSSGPFRPGKPAVRPIEVTFF